MTQKESIHLAGLGLGVATYPVFIALLLLEVTAAPLALIGLPIGLAVCNMYKPSWMS